MRREIHLSSTAIRVLRRMGEGSTFKRIRTFPFPHRYRLSKPDNTGEYAGDIAIDAVAELLEHRLLDAHQQDKMGDTVHYTLTARAATVSATGSLWYDDENQEMFATD